VLAESWSLSTHSWLILDRTGLPIAIFGVAPSVTPGVGIVWLMGTAGIEEEFVAVARQTRRYVAEMHAGLPDTLELRRRPKRAEPSLAGVVGL
jgi:2',3'-cyclic-nucleotide 2'-phosphodiesterase (5'-nucleotidase family)